MVGSTGPGGNSSGHSRLMWLGGGLLLAAVCGVFWLVFGTFSTPPLGADSLPWLSVGLSWLALPLLIGCAVWVWRRVVRPTSASGFAGSDRIDAGFLLGGDVRARGAAASTWKWAVLKKERDGLVGLAILCGISTSIASFYTTFIGSLTFFGLAPQQVVFGFLLALGIQGAMYIASWLVAEEAATHARAGAGARRGQSRRGSFWIKNRTKILILLVCMFASVFFSFASHFKNVYGDERLKLANVQNARSDTTKVLVDAENAIVEERNAVSERLKSSADWAVFNRGLEQLLQIADRQPDLVRKALNERRATAEGELAKIRTEMESKGKALAEVTGKIEAIKAFKAAPDAAQVNDSAGLAQLEQQAATARERKLLFERAAEIEVTTGNDPERVPAECQEIARTQVANRTAAPANAKNAKRRPAADGSVRTRAQTGPVHRCLLQNAQEANINLRRFEAEITRLKGIREGQLTADASRNADIGKLETERTRITSELAVLDSRRSDAEQAYKAIEGNNQQILSSVGNNDFVKTLRGDRDEFLRAGNRAVFDRLIGSCATLLEVVQRTKDVGGAAGQASAAQCDTSRLLAPIDRLTTLNVALERYRAACVVNQEFNTLGDPAKYVSKGSECLAIAKVPERTVAASNVLDRIAQLNHPATAPFERAIASLQRWDILAWLSLALAIAVDVIVLLSALLGARANSSVLLRRGRIDSTEELKDVLAEDTDIRIYGDEPMRVLRAKLCLGAINHRILDPNEPAVPVVDLQRIPQRYRTNVRNFLNSVASADLARALAGFDHLYRIDQDLILQQNRVVGDFERLRELEHGARMSSDDEDWSSVGEAPAPRVTPAGDTADQTRRPASPGAIDDHPIPAGERRRPAPSAPGPTRRFKNGGWPS
jgi:hypothetical protein